MTAPVTPRLLLLTALFTACVELPQSPAPPISSTARDAGVRSTSAHAAPALPDARSRCSVRIGSWNVRKLGFDGAKDLASIAAIVERHFDLIALQEVVWSADDAAYRALGAELGAGWELLRTAAPRPLLSSPHAEYYVVALRRDKVAPCSGESALEYIEDGTGSADSRTRGLFLREPALGCFRTLGADAGNDFALGVYHAEWGSGARADIEGEVAHVDIAFEAMQLRWPEERQRLLLGDFNLVSAALAPLTRASDRSVGAGSTLTEDGGLSDHLYDHLLADGPAADALLCGAARVLDVRGEAFDPRQFRERVSDHLPLVAQVLAIPDDD